MGFEMSIDSGVTETTDTRESSAFHIDQSPWADSVVPIEAPTASTTPQKAEDGTECKGENNDTHDAICDTCFGMILVDTLQMQDGFIKDSTATGKKVLLEGYSRLIIIRDPTSKSYGGLLPQSHFDPLWKLITDTNITLSATLKSTKVLEIVVYGSRTKADEIGGMLLDHDCFLQQPDSFDEFMTYFNPQCLTHADDDDSMPTWQRFGADPDTPAASLSAVEKPKVAELLDAARGPTVFRHVQVSEMLQTSLKGCV
ncbi:hypothetical protein B0I37DRAFT_371876 [Chaetomium sp. MPI-CAGE-AT-0009]|nr:hypothetical protein B0I37DRAFT_371876 [Chaetomium sp. MPI-CAGE-AT-0009]